MIINSKSENTYFKISKLIDELAINKNKAILLKFSDISIKTKYAKQLEKEKKGYYFDFLRKKMSEINIITYDEEDFIKELISISNEIGKNLLVDNVEPLFSTWANENIINLYKLVNRAMSRHVIIIFTYYFPIKNDYMKSERLKIIN